MEASSSRVLALSHRFESLPSHPDPTRNSFYEQSSTLNRLRAKKLISSRQQQQMSPVPTTLTGPCTDPDPSPSPSALRPTTSKPKLRPKRAEQEGKSSSSRTLTLLPAQPPPLLLISPGDEPDHQSTAGPPSSPLLDSQPLPPSILLTPATNPTATSSPHSRRTPSSSPRSRPDTPPQAVITPPTLSQPAVCGLLPAEEEHPASSDPHLQRSSSSASATSAHPVRRFTPPNPSGRRTPTIRMSPGVIAMLNSSRSNSVSSSSTSNYRKSPQVPSSEGGSSTRNSHPNPGVLRHRNFSPASNTTTEHTSLPQDSSASLADSTSPRTSCMPSAGRLQRISQDSDRSSSLFGLGIGLPKRSDLTQSNTIDGLVYSARPSTSTGTYADQQDPTGTSSSSSHPRTRRPHSSLPTAGCEDGGPSTGHPAQKRELPSFSFSTGDQGIEELLETLGYGTGLSKSRSQSSSDELHHSSAPSCRDRDPDGSRGPVKMLDINGKEFSIHEHSLSPVSERTELATNSSRTSGSRNRALINTQQALSQRFLSQQGFAHTAPLSLSPRQKKHLSPPSSTTSVGQNPRYPTDQTSFRQNLSPPTLESSSAHSTPGLTSQPNTASSSRPSLQRVPKKTSQLIQLFESTSSAPSPPSATSSTPQKNSKSPVDLPSVRPTSFQAAPPNRVQYLSNEDRPGAQAIEASRQARAARAERRQASGYSSPDDPASIIPSNSRPPPSPSVESISTAAMLEPSHIEREHAILRNERRERTALAEKGKIAHHPTPITASHPPPYKLKSPISDQLIKHRKSIASTATTNLSDLQVLHSGMIWYRNPRTQRWTETRGILTPEALYLMNENGEVDQTSSDQTIELALRGCSAVESIRSKRSYGPDFSDPHLHMMRIAWVEFDPQTNSRSEHEEFLGCTRATQRADWVGAIWQAAHDLGGFIEQPDIPLAGKSSSTSSPRPVDIDHGDSSRQPGISSPLPASLPPTSPRLDPVALVDRAMSHAKFQPSPPRPVPAPTDCQQPSPPEPFLSPSLSSDPSETTSVITTNLQSEFDRELNTNTGSSLVGHLYSQETGQKLRDLLQQVTEDSDQSRHEYLIDPNLERAPTRAKTPELDIFAMLDRMSVRGSIHRNTAEFYDPPSPNLPQRQSSQNVFNPRPINTLEHADISALEQDASHDSTHHSFRTMCPNSPAGIHERFSTRSSIADPQLRVENAQEQSHPTPKPQRTPSRATNKAEDSLVPDVQSGSAISANGSQTGPSTRKGRGAWSDIERASFQTDNVLNGPVPTRAVQRDLRRILNTIERNDSRRCVESDSLGHHLDNIQHQLQNVASKLRGHQPEREPGYDQEGQEPTIADKVDYMLSLCNVLLESQHKVSTAVENNLRAHGVNIDDRSVHTRSLRSTINSTRTVSHTPHQQGMAGAAPLSPLMEKELDDPKAPGDDRPESPPLPPIPNTPEPDAAETLPPVIVQEAGLGKIENLLVALLKRMDEAAQRQATELAPPVPDKDDETPGGGPVSTSDSDGRSTLALDLDADVALWKSRAKGAGSISRPWKDGEQRGYETNNSAAPSSEPLSDQTPVTESPAVYDQINFQVIPDYNLAYEAEDEVARRIADERARAARRLEGVTTPYGRHHPPIGRNTYHSPSGRRLPSHYQESQHAPLPQEPPALSDPYRSSLPVERDRMSKTLDRSHWSSTTPSPQEPVSSDLPPLPPKKEPLASRPASEMTPSVRSSSRAPSVVTSRNSTRATSVPPQAPHINPEQIRGVFEEVLKLHSSEQAPMFDEMVNLLRTQDQVNQASVLNQSEVSRYLGQLNVHLEGVLKKKNTDISEIAETVGKLEKQLAILLEKTQTPIVQYVEKPLVGQTSAPPQDIEDREPPVQEDDAGGDELVVDTEEGDAGLGLGADNLPDVSAAPGEGQREGEEAPLDPNEPQLHFSSMTKRPSASHRIGGPRARKISLGKSLRGPRLPNGLSTVGGMLFGGPTPAADRAARWGTAGAPRGAGDGGTLKRSPTKQTHVSERLVNVEAALAGVSSGGPAEAPTKAVSEADVDDKAGTIALGVSHILKFLRENHEKEETRRQRKEAEKAAAPKPAIPNEMEERRAKIEELQLRREATLAEDKAKNAEAMLIAIKQQAAEHDKLLKKIAEEMEAKNAKQPDEEENERKRFEAAMEGVNRVLTTVESGVLTHLEEFKAQMFAEMKQTFEKVGELRDQKQQIQADIADMMAFMSKVRGGGPDPRWQFPSPMPSQLGVPEGSVIGGSGPGGGTQAGGFGSQMDQVPRREGTVINGGQAKSVSGFGPRAPR